MGVTEMSDARDLSLANREIAQETINATVRLGRLH
jgi:hypothetical protein